MPHVQSASIDSNDTFDLSRDDRADSARPDYEVRDAKNVDRSSRTSSGMYGVALTSEHPNNDSAMHLQEPQDEMKPQLKRRSMPVGIGHDYAHHADRSADIDALLLPLRDLGSNERNYSYNSDVSRRSAQVFDSEFQLKDHAALPAKQRVQKQSPVIAELKTNVIVSGVYLPLTPLTLTWLARR